MCKFYKIVLSYAQYKKFSGLSGDFTAVKTEYGDSVAVEMAIKTEDAGLFLKKVAETFGGEAAAVKIGTGYFAF